MNRIVPAIFAMLFAALSVAQTPTPKKTLRISVSSPPTTLDPARIIDPLHQRHLQQSFESPLRAAVDGQGRIAIVAGLCEWLPVGTSKTVVRLRVLPGARFHDDACFEGGKGRDVAPRDVVFSLLRIADPEIPSPAWKLFLEGRIEGLDAWRESAERNRVADYDAPPKGLAVDGDAVIVTLVKPYPPLRALLTQTWASIVPVEAFRRYGRDLSDHPIGTGPFRVVERTATVTRFVRHTDGRRVHAGNIDELRLEPVSEPQDVATRFLAGELDAVELLSAHVKHFLNADRTILPAMRGKGVSMVPALPLTTAYLGFNYGSPVLSKKGVREALAFALDRDAIVKVGFTGFAKKVDSPLPTALPEHDMVKNVPWVYAKRDLARAKEALAKEGFGPANPLPPIDFLFADFGDPRVSKAAELIVKQAGDAGITLTPRVETIGPFMDRLGKSEFGVVWASWFADYPDAENFFQLFTTDALNGSWGANYGRYASTRVDSLYGEFAGLEPGLPRMNVSGRLLEAVRADLPWIPIAEISEWILIGKGVRGFAPHLLDWCLGGVSK